jgi:Protein kinase domain/FHA domain
VPRRLSAGTTFGPYRIAGLIGQGGMSVVYLAERLDGGGQVALKVLSEEVAGDADLRSRFTRESRYVSELDHPSIVAVRDSGEVGQLLYIAMDYVEGMDLRAMLSVVGRLKPERAVAILAQVADALDAAHAAGIVHRDVKPANIIVAEDDTAFLTDFGLSKNPGRDSRALTPQGDFVGSLHYTAPEQIVGPAGDQRMDVYSLGCVLYECLTGETPYSAASAVEVMYAHVGDDLPSLLAKRPEMPAQLDAVIATAMAKDPAKRYASCAELIAAARAALGEGEQAEPQLPASTAAEQPSFAPGTLRLQVSLGPAEGRQIGVRDELLIGRGRLGGDAQLSRRHALIARGAGGAYTVEDLGSTNGTFVDGERVRALVALGADSSIRLGGSVLQVVADAPVAEPAAASAPAVAPAPAPLRLAIDVDAAAGVAVLSAAGGAEQARLARDGSPGPWVRRP